MEHGSSLRLLLLSFLNVDSVLSFLKINTQGKAVVKNFTAIKILPIDSRDWSNELFLELSLVREIEIHLSTGVYKGKFLSFSKVSEIVIMNLEIFTLIKNDKEILFAIEEIADLVLVKCRKPKRIKEDGWDCFWSGFENGHVVFCLDKPIGF